MNTRIYTTLDDLIRLQFEAHGFTWLPTQPVSSLLSGRHASRLRGRGLAFEELRDYRAGDDIRTMDWRATARLQKPFVRVYTEERERPMLLLVDQRASMFFGSAVATKSVIAAELAALSAWRALAVGDRVGALIFTDDEVVQIRPHRSRKNVLRICHELVKRNTNLSARSSAANPSLLNKALRQALTTAKHDHLVVLITDYYGDNPATHRLVTNLATHNDVLGLMVYDPLGIRMPPAEHLAATDGQQRLTFRSTERFNERFRKAFEDRAAHVQRQLRGSRIPMLPICTQESVVDQLRRALGARR